MYTFAALKTGSFVAPLILKKISKIKFAPNQFICYRINLVYKECSIFLGATNLFFKIEQFVYFCIFIFSDESKGQL